MGRRLHRKFIKGKISRKMCTKSLNRGQRKKIKQIGGGRGQSALLMPLGDSDSGGESQEDRRKVEKNSKRCNKGNNAPLLVENSG